MMRLTSSTAALCAVTENVDAVISAVLLNVNQAIEPATQETDATKINALASMIVQSLPFASLIQLPQSYCIKNTAAIDAE